MNINQSEVAEHLLPSTNSRSRFNRFPLLISSLAILILAGYFTWRELQLRTSYQLVRDCSEQKDCVDSSKTLEKLVKARKSLKLLNLHNAHLENSHLEHAQLPSANLEDAHLEDAHLENAHLENANLSIAHLENAHLENAHLENVNLSNAHLEGANLQGADLTGAHVSHDYLQGAYLNRANLQGVHLYHADFKQTNFYQANLSRSYFYRANFHKSYLYGANLQDAHFIESQNLTPAQIKSACNWSKAIYKGTWSVSKSKWVVDEQANQQFIRQLQQDKESAPKKPVDCSKWK